LVEATESKVDIGPLLTKVTSQLQNKWVPSRLSALRWVSMLLKKLPGTLFTHTNDLFPALLKTLQDPDDEVVRLDLEVLARICLDTSKKLDQNNFDMVVSSIVRLFRIDRKLLERRGSLIVRQLSVLLNGESIYRALALILLNEHDLEFSGLMVQTLNLILLTSSELFELRRSVKKSLSSESGRDLFIALYKSWCHNPVATFSLCLMAQAYELAAALVLQIADMDITVGFLMQIDKLVQLIESPIFIHLRLQLLEPSRYPFLIKSLYGLLVLLPQSSAFSNLKTRLDSVSALGTLLIPPSDFASISNSEPIHKGSGDTIDFKMLLQLFRLTQDKHQQRRSKVFRQNSLLNESTEIEGIDDQKRDV